jgi:hypothetical protein
VEQLEHLFGNPDFQIMTRFYKIIVSILFVSAAGKAYPQSGHAVETKIVAGKTGFVLLRAGKPYFVKGAGGTNYIDRLAQYGGNSVRTWDSRNGDEVLNKAAKLQLTVTLGLKL